MRFGWLAFRLGIAVLPWLAGCGEGSERRTPVAPAAGGAGGSAGSGSGIPLGLGPSGAGAAAELPGGHLFVGADVLDVHLSLDPATYAELEEHGDREEYVLASAQLSRPGLADVELGQIGVRHKGAFSLHHCWDEFGGVRSHLLECAKLSFKLKFDEYDPGARLDGLKRLNLHASSGDASKLRELLAYQLFRDFGVDAPRAVPARLFVNDRLEGLFIAVEDIDGRYTAAHFPEGPDGNLYKETWPNARADDSTFSAALETNEELGDVADMRAFATAVAQSTPATLATDLEPFVDIEPLVRYLAVDRALRNWDGIMAFYTPLSPHNFFWYHDDGPGRFHLIPWDLDNTLWPFDPYMAPRDWVTSAPVPNFNSRPSDCEERPVWEVASPVRVTPPRCDRLVDALALSQWPRLVEVGQELIQGPLAPEHLLELADGWAHVLEPLVAEDPTLDPLSWQVGLAELRAVIARAGGDLQAFLGEGLIAEPARSEPPQATPEDLLVPTLDAGLLVGGVTNFEFAVPPPTPEPTGVFAYADPLATFAASWSTDAPISGSADLRFDFTFRRGPAPFDEWAGIGVACAETDVTPYSSAVVWLSSDVPRTVRVRIASSAYTDTFGGILGEFGLDFQVGPQPRAIVIDFARLYYPPWARASWTPGQGFPGTDTEALELVLQHFGGLIFGPGATVDAAGELTLPTESGYLRIDNIFFR